MSRPQGTLYEFDDPVAMIIRDPDIDQGPHPSGQFLNLRTR